MRTIPVDVAAFGLLLVMKTPGPALDLDGGPRKNADGVALTDVEIAFAPLDGGPASVVRVRVAGEVDRRIGPGTPVTVVGLRGRSWEIGGRHGLAFSADAVKAVGPVPPARPAPNAT
ncbi:MAG: hypothetical protein ACQSGP_02995 [Frankia sp.]